MNKALDDFASLGISMICVVLSAARLMPLPSWKASRPRLSSRPGSMSLPMEATNEKRTQLGLIHDDAAEYVLGGIPSRSLKSVLTEMKTEIKNKQPDYDLTQVNDHDLARRRIENVDASELIRSDHGTNATLPTREFRDARSRAFRSPLRHD